MKTSLEDHDTARYGDAGGSSVGGLVGVAGGLVAEGFERLFSGGGDKKGTTKANVDKRAQTYSEEDRYQPVHGNSSAAPPPSRYPPLLYESACHVALAQAKPPWPPPFAPYEQRAKVISSWEQQLNLYAVRSQNRNVQISKDMQSRVEKDFCEAVRRQTVNFRPGEQPTLRAFEKSLTGLDRDSEDLQQGPRGEAFSHAPTMGKELQEIQECADDLCMLAPLMQPQNKDLVRGCLRTVDAFSMLASAADANHDTRLAEKFMDGGVALVDAVVDQAFDAASVGGNLIAGVVRGAFGVPYQPWPGHEHSFYLGELVGATLGLAVDGTAIAGGLAGFAGSGAATLQSGGALAVPMASTAQLATALANSGALAVPTHWAALQQASQLLMEKADSQEQRETHDPGAAPATDRAQHWRYSSDLRRSEGRPKVTNPDLEGIFNELYRRRARIGDQSTADAIRHEIATGQRVGRGSHSIKGAQRILQLRRWLRENLHESLTERRAAEHAIDNLIASLKRL